MTSKQRAYLKGLAMTMDPIFQIGKSCLTPEKTKAIDEALEAPGAHQDQCSPELPGRSERDRGCCGRAHVPRWFRSSAKDRPVPGRQKEKKENHSPVKGVTEKW